MELKLTNSLGREKQVFVPVDPAHIRLYVCGPTVYNYAHIGNARPAVVFDVLARLLRWLYPKVTYASNITDIDDKIIAAARETGQTIDSITRRYTEIYRQDMAALGVQTPDVTPLATDHIPEMIAHIARLITLDHAYESQGHVLFHVPSFENYGGLSGRNRDEHIAGARVEVAPYKKDPSDFVLWKPSTEDQPGWDSPWGRGRPGWHIECSAMSEKHLGLPFDIHGGGADLTFPHHENEIAQSCCAHGAPHDLTSYARYWVHNGHLMVEGEKMSKSLGNILLVHDLIAQNQGETIRHALLTTHYRQPFDWTAEALGHSRRTLDRMYQTLLSLEDVPLPETQDQTPPPTDILSALCDDLNTPLALGAVSALAKRAAKDRTPACKAELLAGARLLGLLSSDPHAWLGYGESEEPPSNDLDIPALLSARTQARADKDFTRADAIRDLLASHGITIEDTPSGSKWSRKS